MEIYSVAKDFFKLFNNTLPCLAIPFCRNPSLFPLPGKQSIQKGLESLGICSHQFIGTGGNGLRAFRGVTHGHAGHPHDRGFLGDSSGIGDDCLGVFNQKIEFRGKPRPLTEFHFLV